MSTKDNSTASNGFGMVVHHGSSLVLAVLLWLVIWGNYQPTLDGPDHAFRQALVAGMIALIYVGVQAFAVITQPLGREVRYLIDLLFSLVPLALIGYAVTQALTGQTSLSYYQKGVLSLAGVACAIDVVLFTWFNLKLNKLASDFVQMR